MNTTDNYGLNLPETSDYADIAKLNENTSSIDAQMKANADAAAAKIPLTQKGAASGVAELDSSGKVPSAQLPSYVDDVLEYSNLAAFPAAGETGKIYVAQDTNKTYRWSGSAYVEISQSLALGETSATAYRGDRGKTAYDHSQTTGNPHGATAANVGAATKPTIVTATFATASWTLNATTNCYEQTVAVAGLLASDGKNVRVEPVGNALDSDAQKLTDKAYGKVDYWACNADGYLYGRSPGSAPAVNFQVAVVETR